MQDTRRSSPSIRTLGFSAFFMPVLICVWSIYQLQPPAAVPKDAEEDVFSSERAIIHLQQISRQPHPIGSPEHTVVREYILQQIADLGLRGEVQNTTVQRSYSDSYKRFVNVHNILVRLRGTDNGKALLMLSHYDSVPNSPGATDDGSGVITLLETLRVLADGRRLQNDVIFLFTDGEELGLMGAQAFVDKHPWAANIGLVLNFEGSGSSGQVILFETSTENGWLIEEFARAAPFPIGNSLSYEIYRQMPTDTDLSVFKEAGIAGLNFAYIDSRYNYHTNNDNIENIDARSVQHHGSYAVALARHFGNLDLTRTKSQNAVYFNTVGYHIVSYSEKWVMPLLLFVVLLFVSVLRRGLGNQRLRLRGVLKGLSSFVFSLALIPAAIMLLIRALGEKYQGADWWLLYYNHKPLLVACMLIALALFSGLLNCYRHGMRPLHMILLGIPALLLLYFSEALGWLSAGGALVLITSLYLVFRYGVGQSSLAMGNLFGLLLVTIGVTIWAPGASYILIWPITFVLLAMAIILRRKQDEDLSVGQTILLIIMSCPALVWLSQFAFLSYIALGWHLVAVPIAVMTLLSSMLIPLFFVFLRDGNWNVPRSLVVGGVLLMAVTLINAGFDQRHRKPSSLFYAHNADSGKSVWASTDKKIDGWQLALLSGAKTARLAEFFPNSTATVKSAAGPDSVVQPPTIFLLEDATAGAIRTLKMKISSVRAAPRLNIFIHPDVDLAGAIVDGMEVEQGDNDQKAETKPWQYWRYDALPPDGIEVTLLVRSRGAVEIRVADISYDLPEFPETAPSRPKTEMPKPNSLSDVTIAIKSFRFDSIGGMTRK